MRHPGKKILGLMLIAGLMCGAGLSAADSVFLRLGGSGSMPPTGTFKDVYGASQLGLEARLTLRVVSGLGIWAGYAYTNSAGKTSDLQADTRFKQTLYMAGATYQLPLTGWFSLLAEAAYVRLEDREEAYDQAVTGFANGSLVQVSLVLRPVALVGVVLSGGYQSLIDRSAAPQIDLSGVRAGLSLELRY
jgi:hypothetical protein